MLVSRMVWSMTRRMRSILRGKRRFLHSIRPLLTVVDQFKASQDGGDSADVGHGPAFTSRA